MKVIKKYSTVPLLLFILLQNVTAIPRIDPLVNTNLGLIRGLSSPDGQYAMFMGIPYATVDEGNPFGLAVPHPGFDDVFEAYDDTAICPQTGLFNDTIVGNLDCLHLNVYVPNTASLTNPLPVLVWIYGGGFLTGFAGRYLYGPNYIVRHDIILVTINYRVGPYGFMCLDVPEVPGNQGLKDQELALKWVNDHIESFGGDANKITISGESAGGMSVDLHAHFGSEILFNQIIIQSGTSMLPRGVREPNNDAVLQLSEGLGLITTDVYEALSFLSTVDPHLVIAATLEWNISFSPCVENDYDGVEKFIKDYPINYNIERAQNMPVLIGISDDEGLAWIESLSINNFNQFTENNFNFDDDIAAEMALIIRHFYIGDEVFNERSLIDFNSDTSFNHPTKRSIKKYIDNGATVYQYVFSYVGGRNFVKIEQNITIGGAAHGDDIGYLFDISYMNDVPSPEDQLMIDRITTLWSNFVKFGNPTPETSELLPVIWLPVADESWNFLNLDSELTLQGRPFYDRITFWDLFYNLNEHAQIGYRDQYLKN